MDSRLDKDSELLLDALRGLAALVVLFAHGFELAVGTALGWDSAANPEGWRLARAILGNADWCVWCFFVISGICIHRSIARGVASGKFNWWRYGLARITRLYPLFLIGLGLALIAWSLGLDFAVEEVKARPWRELAASLLNLQIFTTPFPAFGPSWSLSCEVIYYAVWPAVLLSVKGRTSTATRWVMMGSVVVLAGIVVLWQLKPERGSSAVLQGLWTTTALFPLWVTGAAMSSQWEAFTARITRPVWFIGILICAIGAVLSMLMKHAHLPGWRMDMAAWFSLPGLAILLAGGRHLGLAAKPRLIPLCRWLSQFSYPCYILHMPLLLLVHHGLGHLAALKGHAFLHAGLSFGILLVLLAFIGPALERFFMAWRSRVLSGETRA
ncbi:MAG: acyltransferase family protein [Prosthecobacter sp.]